MKNKRMMSAAIAVLMAGSLAACGGSTTASSTADSTPASTASLPLGVYELPHGLFLRTGVDPGGHHRPCYRYPVQNPERMSITKLNKEVFPWLANRKTKNSFRCVPCFFLPVGFYHDLPAAVAGGELIQIQ